VPWQSVNIDTLKDSIVEEDFEEKKLTPKFMAGFSKSSAVSPFRVLNYDYSRRISEELVQEQP